MIPKKKLIIFLVNYKRCAIALKQWPCVAMFPLSWKESVFMIIGRFILNHTESYIKYLKTRFLSIVFWTGAEIWKIYFNADCCALYRQATLRDISTSQLLATVASTAEAQKAFYRNSS